MKNLADLDELCELIVQYADNGDPIKDAIEQSPYFTEELLYELALAHVVASR